MTQVPHRVSVTVSTTVIITGAFVEVVSMGELVGTHGPMGGARVNVDPPLAASRN